MITYIIYKVYTTIFKKTLKQIVKHVYLCLCVGVCFARNPDCVIKYHIVNYSHYRIADLACYLNSYS